MVANKTGSVLYTGVTNSLEKRIWQHKEKVVSGFTERYNVNKLVHYELFLGSMTQLQEKNR